MREVTWRTWREAMTDALYGPAGFYRTAAPVDHFRTSVHVSSAFARGVLQLARLTGLRTVVDLGAGRGELLESLAGLDSELTLVAVEIRERPPELDERIAWVPTMPAVQNAMVVANEWLDNVPLDVVDNGRLVEVSHRSVERAGPEPSERDNVWLAEWGGVEVGHSRDEAWESVVGRLERGVAVAIDYGHVRAARPKESTLAAYRDGRMVSPVPDGSCDLTAWVAMDAVAAAGVRAGATQTRLTTQREALGALGLDGARPPLELAKADPAAYLRALARAGEVGTLLDPNGLGGFTWLVQAKGIELPVELS